MVGEHVSFLVCRISYCTPFADYEPVFVSLDSFDLLVTRHLGTKHVPPFVDILEIAAITTK